MEIVKENERQMTQEELETRCKFLEQQIYIAHKKIDELQDNSLYKTLTLNLEVIKTLKDYNNEERVNAFIHKLIYDLIDGYEEGKSNTTEKTDQ